MQITLYHAAQSRSLTALWFLEELGEPYVIHRLDLKAGDHKKPDYLAINPMGKVPTVVVDGVAVSERPAICAYLADLYPAKDLAPTPTDPLRGEYLKWLFFSVACMEPAFMEKFKGWEVTPMQTAWGSYAETIRTLTQGLEGKTWLVGDRFSAADVNVGAMVHFGMAFALLEGDLFKQYLGRLQARPALQRALAMDAG